MATFESEGLSIAVEDPLVFSDRTFYQRLSEQIETYSHDIRAIGGYWSARIKINDRLDRIEDWIERGLGRHLVVHNPSLEVIWEGFVNRITVNLGVLNSFPLGPLMNIGNRVRVIYSTTDTSTTPPTVGIRAETGVTNDTTSQDRYGIIEKVLSVGGTTASLAEQIRDTWLAEHKDPDTSNRSNLSGSGVPSATLECLGYWHLFKLYSYTSTTSGQHPASTKIQAIANADPNSIISTDFSRITSNGLLVNQYDNKNRKSETVLKEINSKGDNNNNRHNIGVYRDRQIVYGPAPTSIQFNQRITGNEGATDNLNRPIRPWNVTPAEWIFYPDFLVGREPPVTANTLRTDPRSGFIEAVKFTAPWGLSINGEKISELDQMLAKAGLAGVGA
jgi:hypothetical protein